MTKSDACTIAEATEYFAYLDRLRGSGTTNMAGAGPFLVMEFGLDIRLARTVHRAWMATYCGRGRPKRL